MRLVALATVAVLAAGATPAFAAPDYDNDANTPAVTTPPADVQASDQARQDYYQNKLDAAQAQSRADNSMAQADQALADRDAAQDRAASAREDQRADERASDGP